METRYDDWIKRAIDKYEFIEGEDYFILKNEENPGRPRKDYIITLDMAKELCMVSNTEKGTGPKSGKRDSHSGSPTNSPNASKLRKYRTSTLPSSTDKSSRTALASM